MHLTKSLKKLFVFLRFFALFIVTTEGEGAFGGKLIPLFERGAFPFFVFWRFKVYLSKNFKRFVIFILPFFSFFKI